MTLPIHEQARPELRDRELDLLAEEIRGHHRAVERHARSMLDEAIAAGEKLLEAKERLRHGEFKPWVAYCGVSYSSAAVYMRLAHNKYSAALLEADSIREALEALGGKRRKREPEPDLAFRVAKFARRDDWVKAAYTAAMETGRWDALSYYGVRVACDEEDEPVMQEEELPFAVDSDTLKSTEVAPALTAKYAGAPVHSTLVNERLFERSDADIPAVADEEAIERARFPTPTRKEPTPPTVVVNFETEEDRDALVAELGVAVSRSRRQWSAWWPAPPDDGQYQLDDETTLAGEES
jgi:hypothetical protein